MFRALSLFGGLTLLTIGFGLILFFERPQHIDEPQATVEEPVTEVSSSTPPLSATSTATSTPIAEKPKATSTPAVKKTVPVEKPKEEPKNDEGIVYRTENPYASSPLSSDSLNASARGAIVNIFCLTQSGKLGSISGSGVIIDPRGVILTNAHVAQYVLLASQPTIALDCSIRTGSPATAKYEADVMYFPKAWMQVHASDITQTRPKGTGEHDFALLFITKSLDGSNLPSSFPYLSYDSREAIAFTEDSVLLAGFPAEFAGGAITRSSLYPSTVYTKIKDLLTFADKSVDLVSLGNIVLAQSGSSGGAVINLWGKVVGIITTTSEGATTGERELHAITLAYISRELEKATGQDLKEFLQSDAAGRTAKFMEGSAKELADQIISHLP